MKKLNSSLPCQKIYFNSNPEIIIENYENEFTYQYTFDIKYELLAPIIKDMQMVSHLIKCINNHLLSDLIIIYGPNSYSIGSRFYFNYRHIIDFYVKVTEIIEIDYLTKIRYNFYKTGPISKNFFVILSLSKSGENENSSQLKIEIILSKYTVINRKIIDIIYNELNYIYSNLSEAIKTQKHLFCFYKASIVKNEFYILSQIMQNIKLIEYFVNCRLKKINTCGKIEDFNSNDKFIHLNENYEINFNKKKKIINEWISSNNISLKIQFLNVKEDRMRIQYKMNANSLEINSNKDKEIYNLISVHLRKITNTECFILIKSSFGKNIPKNIINEMKKLMTKSMNKIEKLCQISQDKYNF